MKYQDDDIKEYDCTEIQRYKEKKKYVTKTEAAYMLEGKFDENIFLTPTKAYPNPIKRNYQQHQANYLILHCMEEIRVM